MRNPPRDLCVSICPTFVPLLSRRCVRHVGNAAVLRSPAYSARSSLSSGAAKLDRRATPSMHPTGYASLVSTHVVDGVVIS